MRPTDPAAVIERIYDAVVDAERWPAALASTKALLDADGVLLLYCNLSVGRPQVISAVGFDEDALIGFAARHIQDDELIRETLQLPAGEVVSRTIEFSDAETRTTVFCRSLPRSADRIRIAGAAAVRSPTIHGSLWLARDENRPPFSDRDVAALTLLLPHIGRAVTVHHRVANAELEATMAAGAIDRIAVGMVLLDSTGRAILTNREADRIFASNDGLSIRDGLLYAADSQRTARLRRVIERVGRSSGDDEQPIGGAAIRTARSGELPPYHVIVLPLPRRCQPENAAGAVAVAFITGSERGQSPVDVLCGDLYALTAAETRLVSTLVESPGLTTAAKTLGLSRNTVHSQLASVFQKTGTRSQSELLRLILGGIAPVRAPDDTSGYHAVFRSRGSSRD